MEKVSITVELKDKLSLELKKMVSGFAKVADTVYDLHKHLTKTNEGIKNKCVSKAHALVYSLIDVLSVLNLFNDCFESCRIVESEVSKNLAVDFNTCFVDETHQFRV